ncbi:MAG: aminotransferase class I/II-fold pyridoxal phosphate-dependent enzyme [Oscillibacter sp.]|nr:aminotransferase class I/II-fold pyridoxal phosphate-dependent enzyme [Oscillibacter sp.]
MYSFRNDYSEGAHPKIIQALTDTNFQQTCGYGLDPLCQQAANTIRRLCQAPAADVHFLAGGTQTNLTAIASLLRPYEAVIAASTGHVNVHETGAIEATGHKVCAVPTPDGKLTPELAESAAGDRQEHMVYPRMVYVSDTTEVGTVYTKAELTALRQYCDRHGMLLYLDGARLGSALASPENDLTLPEIAALTDAFYIGGTKNGALFGEALVLASPDPHFRWHLKQRGAMLAKGRLLGLQFQALLEDGLYLELARHANEAAFRLRDGLAARKIPFLVDSPSNQQFPILPNTAVQRLQDLGYAFEIQQAMDPDHTCIRLVTSWATPDSAVEDFLRDLPACL